ncbi:hypothetical protein, partial [Pseudomonas aeruginosa]
RGLSFELGGKRTSLLAHQTPLSRRGFSPKSVSGISRPLQGCGITWLADLLVFPDNPPYLEHDGWIHGVRNYGIKEVVPFILPVVPLMGCDGNEIAELASIHRGNPVNE